jgi:hypothetical protein
MARNARIISVVLIVAVAAISRPQISSACSCPLFDHGFLVPARTEFPSNAVGVPWWSEHPTVPVKIVFSVERVEQGQVVPVSFELKVLRDPFDERDIPYPINQIVLVAPVDPFNPGAIYRFTCWERYQIPLVVDGKQVDQQTVEVTISSQSFEANLGQPEVEIGRPKHGRLRVSSSGGMCSTEIDAVMTGVSLYMTATYERWRGALLYDVFVDGEKLWRPSKSFCYRTPPGLSWVGRGEELLFSWCRGKNIEMPPDQNLEPGEHKIEIKAWLPGTDVFIYATNKIELGCQEELDLFRIDD